MHSSRTVAGVARSRLRALIERDGLKLHRDTARLAVKAGVSLTGALKPDSTVLCCDVRAREGHKGREPECIETLVTGV